MASRCWVTLFADLECEDYSGRLQCQQTLLQSRYDRYLSHELGTQQARGLEASIAGEVVDNLHVNAGAVIDEVKVIGSNLAADGIGSIAVGQPRGFLQMSADYSVPAWKSGVGRHDRTALEIRPRYRQQLGRCSVSGKPAAFFCLAHKCGKWLQV